jgi:DNA sulfur modification protein DndD
MGAKIINSICFENFYNYFGNYEDNTYIFPKGLNIVIADNGAGKSKFFNGILWLLKDIVYDSELKKEDRIEDVLFKVVSDKAKDETSIGGKIRVGVKLSFQDSKNEYVIEKHFNIKRIKEGNAFNEKIWEIEDIVREVSKRDLYLKTFHQVYDFDDRKE